MSVQHDTPTGATTSGGDTATEAQPLVVYVEEIDTSVHHACCGWCYPALGTGAVYLAICGVIARVPSPDEDEAVDEYSIPSNACESCAALFRTQSVCPACGRVGAGTL